MEGHRQAVPTAGNFGGGGLVGTSGVTAGAVTLIADSIALHPAKGSINAGNAGVTLRPETNLRAIELGGADSAVQLELTDAELDRITASTVTIGHGFSGPINVSAVISPANYRTLAFGHDVSFAATGGFLADVGPTAASYEKITVTGTVTIADGATFNVASIGGYVAAGGDSFLFLANDAADAILGTFTRPTLTNFLGSVLTANQSYTGGTGNDFVLLATNAAPAIIPAVKLLAGATDADGDTLTLTNVSAVSTNGGTVVMTGTNVTYTPLGGFIGTDAFTYTVSNAAPVPRS